MRPQAAIQRHHRTSVSLIGLLIVSVLISMPAVLRADLKFEKLDSRQTGLESIMQRWREEETERQKTETGTHGWWPWGLRAFDYDLDGDLDLLASHHGRPTSILLRNHQKESGRLTFTNATTELGLKARELPMADDRPWIWDFDGDGYLDIAGISDESRPNSAWNLGGKAFKTTGRPLFFPLSHPKEVIDLNGDGYLDLDGGERGQWFYVPSERTFRRDEKPRFETPKDIPESVAERVKEYRINAGRFAHVLYLTHEIIGYDTLGYAPLPIDLNGDELPDLVVHGSGGYGAAYMGRYLIRQPDGSLADRTEQLGLPEAGAPILTADICGDSRAEILICGKEHGGLYLADKSGRYARKAGPLSDLLTRRDPYLIRAFRADFDNDGDVDLVISQPRLGRETVFENRGDGEFKEILKINGWDSNPVVIADLDQDGRLDLIVGEKTKDKIGDIAVYMNRTAMTGNYAKIHARMPAPNPYAVGSVIEVFPPGELKEPSSRAIVCEKAHADATSVHAGLGTLEKFDLRVTFANGKTLEARNLPAGSRVVADSRQNEVKLTPAEKPE
jgi:hypothetical protein